MNTNHYLDPLRVKAIAEGHAKSLQRAHTTKSREELEKTLREMVIHLAEQARQLDVGTFLQFKNEITALYRLSNRIQMKSMKGNLFEAINTFAFRCCEQEILDLIEIKKQIPSALVQLEKYLLRNDCLRGSAVLGAIMGSIGEQVVSESQRDKLL